jgi:hypothetical protein
MDETEVRECVCGRHFEVTQYAKPWTVCPSCMTDERLNQL